MLSSKNDNVYVLKNVATQCTSDQAIWSECYSMLVVVTIDIMYEMVESICNHK